jgi:hypothetical protein
LNRQCLYFDWDTLTLEELKKKGEGYIVMEEIAATKRGDYTHVGTYSMRSGNILLDCLVLTQFICSEISNMT